MKKTPLKRLTPLGNTAVFGIQRATGTTECRFGVSEGLKRDPNAPRPRKRRKVLVRLGGILENSRYRSFVRSQSCILEQQQAAGNGRVIHICSGRIECAHTGTGAGMGQKTGDETGLPMCVSAHRTGKYSHHALGANFWKFWGKNRDAEVFKMNDLARAEGIPLYVKAK